MQLPSGCCVHCPGRDRNSAQGWVCTSAAMGQTTAHMHGHHEATMGLARVSLGRQLRALGSRVHCTLSAEKLRVQVRCPSACATTFWYR